MNQQHQTEDATIELTDEQCNEFRRLPCNFNNMLRSAYNTGRNKEQERCAGIVYGQFSGDNAAERTAKAIRKVSYKVKFPNQFLKTT